MVGLLAVAFVAPMPAMLKYPTWAQDEGTLLVFPSLMLKGGTPNSTFLSIYGPANLYALTAAFFVAGQSVLVERLVAVFYHLVLVGSLTALVWQRRRPFAGVAAGSITVVVGVSYPMMAFAWLGGIAFCPWAPPARRRPRRPQSPACRRLGRAVAGSRHLVSSRPVRGRAPDLDGAGGKPASSELSSWCRVFFLA